MTEGRKAMTDHAQTMLELADEIECRHGDDHNGNRSYLFTREQRGMVLAALRSPAIGTPDTPCEYCGNGKQTGLPGNACENCMNTGLKRPPAIGTMDREYDPDVAPCDDGEFGMKP